MSVSDIPAQPTNLTSNPNRRPLILITLVALAWDEWQRPRDWRSWTFRAARLDRYLRDHTTLAR
ncbi:MULTISPECIES: hypothetical protein [Rhizobium]|uniref:hypothetical protein n=1 Tax=Rhizobium TaxID=379 RepID=UPI0019580058|nr:MULTISPECIES: hypothetical protein [Rhizobium]MBM7046857.1 hypothetical protein [Rhizobium lusitanum]